MSGELKGPEPQVQSVDPNQGASEIGGAPGDGSNSNESALWRAVRLVILLGAIVALGVTQGWGMLIVVAAIVVIIFMHELGHFVMARRAGMLATEFFIGFGPKIFSFRRGETEYGLKVIPAGAYVRIVGMSSLEEVDPAVESRTYRQAKFWDRLGVAVAGSAMHFIMAFAILISLFVFVGSPSEDEWRVRNVTPGSAADEAGIRDGDQIAELNGVAVGSFDSFRSRLTSVEPGESTFVVERGDQTLDLTANLALRAKVIGTVGEDLDIMDTGSGPVIVNPYPGGVVEGAGLVGGEHIEAINGVAIGDINDVDRAVAARSDGSVEVTVAAAESGSRSVVLDLGSATDTVAPKAFLGVGEEPVLIRKGLLPAVGESVMTFGRVTKASVVGVAKFLWPPNIARFVTDTITGADHTDRTDRPTPAESTPLGAEANRPISIVGVALIGSDLTSSGISSLLEFLALVNIFFGVFNMFPMLPFDGGHVVIAVYERIRELSGHTQGRYMSDVSRLLPAAYVVVGVLVVVGLLAMFLDITKGVSL